MAGRCFAEIAAPTIDGVWEQGAILRGQLPAGYSVTFLKHSVPVSSDGAFVIGLGRDFPRQAEITVSDQNGVIKKFQYPVKPRDYKIQKVNGVPAKTVNPGAEHLARIRKESALVKEARKAITSRQDFRSAFSWPLLGPITGVYGSQRYYNGEPRRPHFGVDVGAPTGTRVSAPAGGLVTLAYDDMFFSGGTLIIDHGHGLSSTFIHLSKILVDQGAEVEQGQVVAEVGATGRATGPHLDWRMNWFDQRVDPTFLVPTMEQAQAEFQDKIADNAVEVE